MFSLGDDKEVHISTTDLRGIATWLHAQTSKKSINVVQCEVSAIFAI